jgi:hypothetical protein
MANLRPVIVRALAYRFRREGREIFVQLVKIHDLVRDGGMPPKGMARPDAAVPNAFLESIAAPWLRRLGSCLSASTGTMRGLEIG